MSMQSLCTDDGMKEVIETYSDMIYRIAVAHMRTKEDAEDIYQEVFLIYLQKQQAFREEEHRKAWLIRTTLICCKRALLSSWKKRNILTEDVAEVFSGTGKEKEPITSFELKEENEVYTAVRSLPQKYRTVRMQLTRGREMMKELLVDCDGKGGSRRG